MEGHVAEDASVSERDVNRVERAIKGGKKRSTIFPRLGSIQAVTAGTGVAVTVHFTKRGGAPVSFVPADDPRDAAAVREVDLQRKYRYSPRDLAEQLGLTPPRTTALRRYLKIEDDEDSHHVFVFDSQRHSRYSDRALERLREARDTVDMDAVWQEHGPRRRPRP